MREVCSGEGQASAAATTGNEERRPCWRWAASSAHTRLACPRPSPDRRLSSLADQDGPTFPTLCSPRKTSLNFLSCGPGQEGGRGVSAWQVEEGAARGAQARRPREGDARGSRTSSRPGRSPDPSETLLAGARGSTWQRRGTEECRGLAVEEGSRRRKGRRGSRSAVSGWATASARRVRRAITQPDQEPTQPVPVERGERRKRITVALRSHAASIHSRARELAAGHLVPPTASPPALASSSQAPNLPDHAPSQGRLGKFLRGRPV